MNKILWVYENAPIFCIIVSGIKDSQFYMDLIQ